MNIERVSTEVQLKALARLIRLGNAAVDSLFNTTIGTFHCPNKDLFAHHGQALGNTWLQPDSHHLKDGDRIKALRVRTNTYPTNAMLHHNNEAVCRLVAKYRPAATILTEHVYQSPTGDRLKPDIIVHEGNTVTIADVAVSWDDLPASLTRMCNFKSAKYDCLRPMFPDKVVTAVGLAFGARSMLCTETSF
ncbi:uncharacterized protein LOC120844572 [Ixodes scapularis]|uniref:uncharacterized protein LOC120844572 n=1 Tax=Ixodes scapularis TaxID=6945 RepID=UPI001A9FB092|nr:uncharacterized protein LOC120844572 [Ixodes scapularis]